MTKPVRPRTVHTYHGHLRTFFAWVVREEVLPASPMDLIPIPTKRDDQIQPFTQAQVNALLTAAKRSTYPRRDEAILFFLLDTGVRASELCSLRIENVDLSSRRETVLGKGNKHRSVPFHKTCPANRRFAEALRAAYEACYEVSKERGWLGDGPEEMLEDWLADVEQEVYGPKGYREG